MSTIVPPDQPENTEARRTPIPKRLRFEVLRRDNHTCRYCGAAAPDVKLTVDHVTPVVLGGQTIPENLVTACHDCNTGKTSTVPDAPVVADVAQDAIRWKQAIEQAAAVMQRDEEAKQAVIREVMTAWLNRWAVSRPEDEYPPLPTGAEGSIERWFTRGLPIATMCRLVDVACSKYDRTRGTMTRPEVWPYYAGCCWRALTELEEAAKALYDEERGK